MSFRRFLTGLSVSLIALMTVAAPTLAQQQSSGLEVSPTRSELTVEPGSSVPFEVNVKNVTKGVVTIKSTVDDFKPAEDGSPQVIPYSTQPQPTSIKPFVSAPEEFTLQPGDSKKLTITATAPAKQAAGAYYGVIRFQAIPGNSGSETGGGQVALSASVGHIVLIQVPGNLTEKLQLDSVKAAQNDKTSTLFATPPNKVIVQVTNTGNSFVKPFGTVSITKGGKEVYTYQLNNQDQKANVLPKSSRTFKEDIKGLKGVGKFTITANITYGNGSEILTQKSTFWVIPVWLAIVVGVGIVLLVGLVLYLIRRFRK